MFHDIAGGQPFERSFDFSTFPNLEEVRFDVGWKSGRLLWIPTALATLRPSTSPRLSEIQLSLDYPPAAETVIEATGHDLRQVADEVSRIESEFKGQVEVFVYRSPAFDAVSAILDVRFHPYGVDDSP